MHIDEKKINRIYEVIGSKNQRFLLKVIGEKRAVIYSEMKKEFLTGLNLPNLRHNSIFAYYIRKLRMLDMVIQNKETRTWHLTRIGVRVLRLIRNFEKICTAYDISDLASDGKVETIVKGRKL